MFLVLDTDYELLILASVEAALAHLETIDLENDEYEMCDDTGQRFTAAILKPAFAFIGGDFRLVPTGLRDAKLPLQFIERAQSFWSQVGALRTLEDARKHFLDT
jgi:hypothetical protein